MRRTLTIAVLAAVLLAARPPASAAQAASIPLILGVTATPNELAAGGTTAVDVRLKNYRGDTVPAPEAVTVTLHSELSGDTSVPFKVGQSVARTDIRFQRSGVANLVAAAPNMTSGTVSVVVKAGAATQATAPTSESAHAALSSRPTPAPPPSRPLPPPLASAPPQKVLLTVDVLPDHVHPTNAAWLAKVLVTAVNESRQPIAVQADTPIQLTTDVGVLNPGFATIAAGHARTPEIQLTSTRAGAGTLWAWTDTGELGRAAVEYHNAEPAQIALKALPSRTVNDGRTAVNVTVFLQDETSGIVKAGEDMQVKLTSSVGTPKPSVLSIAKGQFVGEAILTSAVAGNAEITATTPGLTAGMASVEFAFPYLLVLLAGIGGLIGALVRSSGDTFTGAWWRHLLGSVAIGAVLGLLFYLLAAFGVVASIPKLSIPLEQLPTTNEFAALVLGFFGGYYARAWLPNPAT